MRSRPGAPRPGELRWLASFAPSQVAVTWRERLRAGVGALFGVALAGAAAHWLLGGDASVPFLIAPMGASAVLLFGVPASPLAQPWSIIGGNLVSSAVGVTAAMWIADPLAAAAVAIGAAICTMFTLRCAHPPSGAVALTAVLGGPAVHTLGYGFVLAPVALQSFLLLGSALVYHAATGQRYPHAARATKAAGPAPERAGFSRADLEAVLRQRDEFFDIDTEDFEAILHDAITRANARYFGTLASANLKSGDDLTPAMTGPEERNRLPRHGAKALPVLDTQRH